MPDRFQNKYRISSARLQTWDYASEGAYFISICTHNREHYFGEIENHSMKLLNNGLIADLMWYEIKNHAKNIELGEFVVMPNQVQGILILNGNVGNTVNAETRHALSRPIKPIETNETNQPPHGNSPSNVLQPSPIRRQSFSKPGEKYHFGDYWRIQIGSYKTRQSFRI